MDSVIVVMNASQAWQGEEQEKDSGLGKMGRGLKPPKFSRWGADNTGTAITSDTGP